MTLKKSVCIIAAFIAMATLFCPTTAYSKPWLERYLHYLARFNILPYNKLDSITTYLDSTVATAHCYKFITNKEKTKFIAFYSVDRDDKSFLQIDKGYEYIDPKGMDLTFTESKIIKPGEKEFILYKVYGMFYNGKWYYYKSSYHKIFEKNIMDAKNEHLLEDLLRTSYMSGIVMSARKDFWKEGEFALKNNRKHDGLQALPQLMIDAASQNKQRDALKLK